MRRNESISYDYDPSFEKATMISIPLNRVTAMLSQIATKSMYKCLLKRKDITFDTVSIGTESEKFKVHIIAPAKIKKANPCLIYIHGGGFIYDAAESQYKNAAEYAMETDSIVIFVRYRLLPKYAFPCARDDCHKAYEWVVENAEKYNIDINCIGIGGDSAGGYLAAELTNTLTNEGKRVQYQLLVYPVIDNTMRTKSMQKYIDTPLWNARLNAIMWAWYYLGTERKETSLLDIELPDNLPPTYIETAQFDCLHDEGIMYADKLKENGVKVIVNETNKTIHGFDVTQCDITDKAVNERISFIRMMDGSSQALSITRD